MAVQTAPKGRKSTNPPGTPSPGVGVHRAAVLVMRFILASVLALASGFFLTGSRDAQSDERPAAIGVTDSPTTILRWQVLGYALVGPTFFLPSAVAVDARGNAYVLDTGNQRVVEISPSGRVLRRWGVAQPSAPILGGGLGSIAPGRMLTSSIALDAEGIVYVPSNDTNCVQKYSESGRLLTWSGRAKICLSPTFAGGLNVAIGRRGTMFLANGSRIVTFSASGRLLSTWDHFGPDGRGLALALAIDSSGNVFALVSFNLGTCSPVSGGSSGCAGTGYRIEKRSPAGRLLTQWKTGTGEDESISASLALNQQGNVYLDDRSAHRIVKFSASGRIVAQRTGSGTAPGDFRSPNGLAVGPRGTIFVADSFNNRVQKLTSDLRPLGQWGVGGNWPGQFSFPTAVAVAADGMISVGDEGNSRIVQVTPAGRAEAIWTPPRFYLDSQFQVGRKPLAVSLRGDVYTSDEFTGSVLRYSRQGKLLAQGACPPPECPGYADGPHTLAVGRNGVYVGTPSDLVELSPGLVVRSSRPSVIERLTSDQQGNVFSDVLPMHENCCTVGALSPEGKITSGAMIRHNLYSWGGMAIDGAGNIYVTETDEDIVKKLSPTGQLLARWGASGSDPGQFHAPTGIALNARGDVYVADTGNDRIQKLVVGQ